LFICFQKNIEKGFEYIKKNFLNNKNFQVPEKRSNFNIEELRKRHKYGLFTQNEIRGSKLSGISTYSDGTHDMIGESQNTGKDGLSGPSENGIYPGGQFPITTTHSGGYYFIPPVPNKNIAQISEQFFD
jgi:deferrochelatase/peroxidase EfeB